MTVHSRLVPDNGPKMDRDGQQDGDSCGLVIVFELKWIIMNLYITFFVVNVDLNDH